MRDAPNNPFLAWLDGSADPPFPGRLAQARHAHRVLQRRLHRLTTRILASSPAHAVPLFDRWTRTLTRLDTFSTWLMRTNPFRANGDREGWSHAQNAIDTGIVRARVALLQGQGRAVLRAVLRLKTLTVSERTIVQDVLTWAGDTREMASRVATLERQRAAREEALNARQARSGGLYLENTVGLGLPESASRKRYLKQARALARSRGWARGYLVAPWSDTADWIYRYSSNPVLRRSVWRLNQKTSSTQWHVEDMRQARHEQALSEGSATWAERQASGSVVGSLKRRVRLLEVAVEVARSPAESLLRTMRARAAARGQPSIDPSWDYGKLEELAPVQRVTEDVDAAIFPWEATVRTALPELLAITGWTLRAEPDRFGSDQAPLLRFRLQHATRGRAQLWYAPDDPVLADSDYAGAFAMSVRGAWDNAEAERMVWVSQRVPMDVGGFDLANVVKLAHEIGHAMHYLNIDDKVPNASADVPNDMAEVPSYLLECYAADPSVLARWASSTSARRRSYWRSRLSPEGNEALHALDASMDALLDIRAHSTHPGEASYKSLHAQVLERAGRVVDKEGRWADAHNRFIWSADDAGCDVSHLLGKALVHRLLVHRTDGCFNAADVAAVYADLTNHVLVTGTGPDRWRRQWRHWLGEHAFASVGRGLRAQARHNRRIVRAVRRKWTASER